MTYVVTSPCVDVKDGSCVLSCPVDCIYTGGRMFYIHPEECIDCGLCESVCPVGAIYPEDALPIAEKAFLEANAEFFGPEVTGWGTPGGAKYIGESALDHPLIFKKKL